MTRDVFHFDMSGNDINELQKVNKEFSSLAFEVFQFEISGKNFNESQ